MDLFWTQITLFGDRFFKLEKLKIMNNIYTFAFSLLICLSLNSCWDGVDIDLPDLNPLTQEGAEISIVEINASFSYDGTTTNSVQFDDNFSWEFDVDGDQIMDMGLVSYYRGPTVGGLPGEAYGVRLGMNNVEIMRKSDLFPLSEPGELIGIAVFLPANALAGSTVNGVWANPGILQRVILDENTILTNKWNVKPDAPFGLSYIPIRTNAGGEYYYGWIEIFSTNYNDNVSQDVFVINRLGISNTPGLRLRMGEE